MPRGVTPAGIRAGEPGSLAGLVELRGRAVRAYAGAVAEQGGALVAATEAMASFRTHVVGAVDVGGLDPDSTLLRAVRESSAARAPRPAESGPRLRRLARRGGNVCELVPRLLAARANRELSNEDVVRLDRHLASCRECRELRERFRTAESLYAETAGTPLPERDARTLLLALARAAPLAEGTPESVAHEALALLSGETVSRPDPARAAPPAVTPPSEAPPPETAPAEPRSDTPAATPPPSPADTPPASPAEAPPAQPRPPDPWPSDPAAADVRPAQRPARPEAPAGPNGRDAPPTDRAEASPGPATAAHGALIGTTPGRVSFARRTVTIRSGVERSGPAAPSPEPEPEPEPKLEPEPPVAEAPAPPLGPEPTEPSLPEAEDPHHAPDAQQSSPPETAVPVVEPPPVAPATSPAPTATPGAGAPPDSGTLARFVPGVLIVMAIGIALVVAGLLGASNDPATSDDIDPPSLREPVNDLDTTGTPPAPGSDAN